VTLNASLKHPMPEAHMTSEALGALNKELGGTKCASFCWTKEQSGLR
jgi:hypothetical protein